MIANDLYAYENPLIPDIGIAGHPARSTSLQGFRWLITNLPYNEQDELAAHLVALGARDGCNIALLTRVNGSWRANAARSCIRIATSPASFF